MELITIKTFDQSYKAHIVRGKLSIEGIESYLFDEHIYNLDPLYNIAIGGIKLKIKKEDEQKALELISELDNIKSTDIQGQIILCPKCNSDEIYSGYKSIKSIKSIFAFVISLIFSAFPFYYDILYKCKICGNEFKIK